MKRLAILLGAAALLVSSWLLISSISSGGTKYVRLAIPDDTADSAALIRSAHQLWRAKPGIYDPFSVVRLMRRLGEKLHNGEWDTVSSPVFFAWQKYRTLPNVRAAVAEGNAIWLPKFAQSLSIPELEALVRIAAAKRFDAAGIDAALTAAASAPLPPDGYSRSRPSEIVIAALRVREFDRAKGYLEKLSWPEKIDVSKRGTLVARLGSLIEVCSRAKQGKADVPAALELWRGFGPDMRERHFLRSVLEDVAMQAIDALEKVDKAGDVAGLLAETFLHDAAYGYWHPVIRRRLEKMPGANGQQLASFSVLLREFEGRFGSFEFEARTWMEVAELARTKKPQEPLLRAKYYRLALASAHLDWTRWRAAVGAAEELQRGREYAEGFRVVEEALQSVEDLELRSALLALGDEVRARVEGDNERVAQERLQVEQDRVRGQLRHLVGQLGVARKYGRTAEEVDALERAIKDLEKKVPE